MNFPKYWARGRSGDFYAWSWSGLSLAEAQAFADQKARQIEELYHNGRFAPEDHGAYYPNRPFREQVLQEFKNPAGEIAAVVTRNSYGCLVLNTARVMFVDIDLPPPKPTGGFFQKLFGKTEPPPAINPAENSALAKVEMWTRHHPDWGWRIYRTRAGLRLLATHGPVEPASSAANEALAALGSDPLYVKLCLSQKCYRARLTPKPWRCGVHAKPERWPFLDARAESKFEKWEKLYQSYAFNWATCAFIRQTGNPMVHDEAQAIVKVHDESTKVNSQLQLA